MKDLINETLIEVMKKPQFYRHSCGGGGNVQMVNVTSESPDFTCKYQGDKNWLTPACETCTGLHQNEMELTTGERAFNQAVQIFATALKAKGETS